jgi:cell division septal protein FtsQ
MARKKKSNIQPFVVKAVLIFFLAGGVMYFVGSRLVQVFKTAEFFRVRSVVIDPSLQFINKADLKGIFGRNIFSIDLKAVQAKLSRRYPQASHLRLVKRFPNQVLIVARKRLPFAYLKTEGRTITLDEEGVILSVDGSHDDTLPDIVGINTDRTRVVAGLPLGGPNLRTALQIIRLFNADKSLSEYSIKEVNASNLSKIYFHLSNSLEIFIDRDNMTHSVKVLGVLLSQNEFEIQNAKYIDLRFKEPIIGKK